MSPLCSQWMIIFTHHHFAVLDLSLSMVSAVLEKSIRVSTVCLCNFRDSWTNSCWLSTSSCTDWVNASKDRDAEPRSSRDVRCCCTLWNSCWESATEGSESVGGALEEAETVVGRRALSATEEEQDWVLGGPGVNKAPASGADEPWLLFLEYV